ncbi:hypothetical protein GCM10009733_020280 [Nonomuraea maheshkhaliensis]|uniref:HTH cro/C1-type domain-containing protein n=1 Tax=Nonomuraea maheshkhaliensis TaxID=419590 RepID=A0ABP4QZL9_9ACTN
MFKLEDLVALRKGRGLTHEQVASRMVMTVSNLKRLERTFLSGEGAHALTVFDYAAAIGYPLRPTVEQLVRHRVATDPSPHRVAEAMGIGVGSVRRLERKLMSGGGGHIRTVLKYSAAVGMPLTPTPDPDFTLPPDNPAPRSRSSTTPTMSQRQRAEETHNLAEQVRQMKAADIRIQDIATRLQMDRKTIRRYLDPARTQQQLARERHRDQERRRLAARAHQMDADGKNVKEIAESLQISHSSVLRYMKQYPAEADG